MGRVMGEGFGWVKEEGYVLENGRVMVEKGECYGSEKGKVEGGERGRVMAGKRWRVAGVKKGRLMVGK